MPRRGSRTVAVEQHSEPACVSHLSRSPSAHLTPNQSGTHAALVPRRGSRTAEQRSEPDCVDIADMTLSVFRGECRPNSALPARNPTDASAHHPWNYVNLFYPIASHAPSESRPWPLPPGAPLPPAESDATPGAASVRYEQTARIRLTLSAAPPRGGATLEGAHLPASAQAGAQGGPRPARVYSPKAAGLARLTLLNGGACQWSHSSPPGPSVTSQRRAPAEPPAGSARTESSTSSLAARVQGLTGGLGCEPGCPLCQCTLSGFSELNVHAGTRKARCGFQLMLASESLEVSVALWHCRQSPSWRLGATQWQTESHRAQALSATPSPPPRTANQGT